MSTPIVTFKDADFTHKDRNINLHALSLYLAISLPLLGLTIFGWWLFYRREGKKAKKDDVGT